MTTTYDIIIGDVVQLPSGSQRMTATKVDGAMIEVVWMLYNNGMMQTAVLPIQAVRVV